LPDSSKAVEIVLPLSAFDHRLSYPFPQLAPGESVEEGIRYFPLRRTEDPEKYAIGRVFLQEAYLIVDYERHNFSVSQAQFSADALTNANIVPIDAYWATAQDSVADSLTIAAKAGIAVGVSIFVVFAGLLIFLWFRWRRNLEADKEGKTIDNGGRNRILRFWHRRTPPCLPSELLADQRAPTEVPADASTAVCELPAVTPVELEANSYYPGSGGLKGGSDSSQTQSEEVSEPEPPEPPVETRPPMPVARLLLGRIDTTFSHPSSNFPSPLGASSLSDGSHSLGVPSPLTGYGEGPGFGNLAMGSQPPTSSAHPTAQSPTSNPEPRSRVVEGDTIEGNDPPQEPQALSPLRTKFSWEK
jgi:hypothetical protein